MILGSMISWPWRLPWLGVTAKGFTPSVHWSGETQCRSPKLNVAVESRGQNSLVIIDSDKSLEQDFEQINRSEDRSTQALNLDPYEGLPPCSSDGTRWLYYPEIW